METGTKRRGEPVRQGVLDAAERLLRDGKAEFSMRELASEARVSFATPFNQFGSKPAIMHALSGRRIDSMMTRFDAAPQPALAADRVALAINIAVAVMLDEPIVNRAVMAWIGTGSTASGEVRSNSTALWAHALGDGTGLASLRRDEACRILPGQLALAFRGALSFWTAGELADEELGPAARQIADTLLRAYYCD
ncbi:transcriptional regulator, TetR family [Sphingobium sp. YR768]|nr:transcriptional regulator, TetR family [Sphingobium sp. YR768]